MSPLTDFGAIVRLERSFWWIEDTQILCEEVQNDISQRDHCTGLGLAVVDNENAVDPLFDEYLEDWENCRSRGKRDQWFESSIAMTEEVTNGEGQEAQVIHLHPYQT